MCSRVRVVDVPSAGIVDIDWSHMKSVWANQHPMDSTGLMVKQAEALKALNPKVRQPRATTQRLIIGVVGGGVCGVCVCVCAGGGSKGAAD